MVTAISPLDRVEQEHIHFVLDWIESGCVGRREAKEELGIEAEFVSDKPLLLTTTKTVGSIDKHTDASLWLMLKCDPRQSLDYDFNEFNQIRWF